MKKFEEFIFESDMAFSDIDLSKIDQDVPHYWLDPLWEP